MKRGKPNGAVFSPPCAHAPSPSAETVRYDAVGEVANAVMFNPVAPEAAVRMLRDAKTEETVASVD